VQVSAKFQKTQLVPSVARVSSNNFLYNISACNQEIQQQVCNNMMMGTENVCGDAEISRVYTKRQVSPPNPNNHGVCQKHITLIVNCVVNFSAISHPPSYSYTNRTEILASTFYTALLPNLLFLHFTVQQNLVFSTFNNS